VQGALKLILEPIFEADFRPGSFGYRPKRSAQDAVIRVAQAIVQEKTRAIDIDLRSYFDNVRHDRLLAKVAQRVDDVDGCENPDKSGGGCRVTAEASELAGLLAGRAVCRSINCGCTSSII
jgi:hypothetical protein